MNRRMRMAVVAPVGVSMLALGSAALVAAPAQAAVPSATCTVTANTVASNRVDVKGNGFKPAVDVLVLSRNGNKQIRTSADGTFKLIAQKAGSSFSVKEGNKGRTQCGTVKQAEQKDTEDQFKKGFTQGFSATKDLCKKPNANQNLQAVDPNFEKGFNAGVTAALNSKFCK
ncbi:hypothetical protein ACQEVM_20635 [Streptomyces sp. CA-243310]|uniref:hypothetical protein n=1 Tax=Streptomyces sp. CA-243310 TaxID=3240056 RepID=UPI003D92A1A8